MDKSLLKRGGALLAAFLCLGANTLRADNDRRDDSDRDRDRGRGSSTSVTQRGQTEDPELDLDDVTSGRDAIRALGNRLPEVAQSHHLDASQLALRLQTDPDLHVDRTGRLFYECTGAADLPWGPDEAPAVTLGGTASGVAPAPLANTFLLHSRAGASRVIFLDFDGNTTKGTVWNTSFASGAAIATPPFDLDGNPAAFSDAELQRIQLIWQRVAEDYVAFDVDVTTQDPGTDGLQKTTSTDTAYGIRVCVGGSSYDWYGSAVGGVSFVGSFDWSSDTPNFVFPAQLGNGDEKYTAEAISHEVGHAFSLLHDGQNPSTAYYAGQGAAPMTWAPIMGVSYSANISQFSKGEYTGANNTQDDLALIASYVGYRPDDHGNTQSTATYLPAGATVAASGVITGQTDVDVIAFSSAAGTINLTLTSGTEDADLDIAAELHDATGAVLATSNPAATLGASFNLTVPAGTYFVFVRGAGYLDPLTTGYSAYGSIGSWALSGVVPNPAGSVPPVSVPTASTSSGKAPLAVTFGGSGSFDQDGFITAYNWTFSDGTTATGATVTKTISTAGTYTASLTVTDNSGLSATASVAVSVSSANLAPTARITSATPTVSSTFTGYAPLAIAFSGKSSSDPDGTIKSYKWSFGDGGTSTSASPSHTYTKVGTYTATLTVTDNAGATASASVPVTVLQDPARVIRVQSLSVAMVSGHGQATVVVTDLNGLPVSGVTVSGRWSGIVSASGNASTDSTGTARLNSANTNKKGTLTFTVSSLSKSGNTYDATKNLTGSGNVVAAPVAGGGH